MKEGQRRGGGGERRGRSQVKVVAGLTGCGRMKLAASGATRATPCCFAASLNRSCSALSCASSWLGLGSGVGLGLGSCSALSCASSWLAIVGGVVAGCWWDGSGW